MAVSDEDHGDLSRPENASIHRGGCPSLTVPPDFPPKPAAPSLDDLPDEILVEILHYIDPHSRDRVLGHIPDDPPPTFPDNHLLKDFLVSSQSYCSLARVNKRFGRLAQEALFSAPILRRSVGASSKTYERISLFLWALLKRPALGYHVRFLRLYEDRIPTDRQPTNGDHSTWFGVDVSDLQADAYNMMTQPGISDYLRTSWVCRLGPGLEFYIYEAILALLPRLELLVLSGTRSYKSQRLGTYMIRHDFDFPHSMMLATFPCSYTLKYLKTSRYLPFTLEELSFLPYIKTFDISVPLYGLAFHAMCQWSSDPLRNMRFGQIYHVRIDCQLKTVGMWDREASRNLKEVVGLFTQLRRLDFYAEPSIAKNPFKSEHARAEYQANIQYYPDPVPPPHLVIQISEQQWHQDIYNARTQYTDYQNLIDWIHHLRGKLEYLTLPGGFWTLPGGARKRLPRFEKFERLTQLVIPQAAIISLKLDNMRSLDEEHGDFELTPDHALPGVLERLKIFDADTSLLESRWLRELFEGHTTGGKCRSLQTLEILFGYDVGDEMLSDVLKRRKFEQFWERVKRAGFKVILGRDNEEPSVTF